MDSPKIISQKVILETGLFDVKETEIQLEKNKKILYDVFRRPTVSVFPLTEKYEVYFISEYRYLHKRNVLGAVAGFVEEKESTLSAAKRELKEEAGIEASQFEEIGRVELAASVFKAQCHIFLAKGLETGLQNLEEDERITVVKIPLQEAVKKVMNGEINTSISMIGILMLDKLRKEKKL
ncbi:NUDIX hydrolase [Candidatus Microgenomates bacterium]|nr:MAG: NUDIX hydrolase [Candidatus Microgenomates bacterium]